MLHYEAANAVSALVMKGDMSLAEKGAKHCDAAADICSSETPGTPYHQLAEYVIGLKQSLGS